jgi:hypothetical protein
MQSTTTRKIGAIDGEYPYLRQVRSWYRWQCGQEIDPAIIVSCYLLKKIGIAIPAGTDMAQIDTNISQLIDAGIITINNCPELFKCKN